MGVVGVGKAVWKEDANALAIQIAMKTRVCDFVVSKSCMKGGGLELYIIIHVVNNVARTSDISGLICPS